MTVTMAQVRKALDPEEPDYDAAAQLGAEALPHLETLIDQGDPMLASKAAYLAALIPHERAVDVVRKAAKSEDVVVRVAAAAAARGLSGADAADVLSPLLEDGDQGVRKVALNSVQADTSHEVRDALERLMRSESDPGLQDTARRALDRLTFRDRHASQPAVSSEGEGKGMGGGSIDVDAPGAQDEDERSGIGRGGGSLPAQFRTPDPAAGGNTPETSGGAGCGGGSFGDSDGDAATTAPGRGEGGGSFNG